MIQRNICGQVGEYHLELSAGMNIYSDLVQPPILTGYVHDRL